jgi:hypothetical protein
MSGNKLILQHPAQLPAPPLSKYVHTPKKIPPAPRMTINVSVNTNGICILLMLNSVYLFFIFFYYFFFIIFIIAIVLSWNVDLNNTHAEISNYQIFTYKESPTDIPRSAFWKEIGKVDALPLPMICSLNNVSVFIITFEYNLILNKIVLDYCWRKIPFCN